MNKLPLAGLAVIGLLLATPETVSAHGGQYRGPGDLLPPLSGGGSRYPMPGGPSRPEPAGPGADRPAGPFGPLRDSSDGPVLLADDLTSWQFWWEFNKDPYLDRRDAGPGAATVAGPGERAPGRGGQRPPTVRRGPSEEQIRGEILPALARNLESSDQRDIVSSCVIALAKIGRDSDEIQILSIFRKALSHGEQEVRESAALALGISQRPEVVPDLIELTRNTAVGQEMVGGGDVNHRIRAFAVFGLGLVGHATADHDVKATIHRALDELLTDAEVRVRNIRVPVIHSIGLLRPDVSTEEGRELFVACLESLRGYWDERLNLGEQWVQAHVPPSVAKLFESVDGGVAANAELAALKTEFVEALLEDVTGRARFPRRAQVIVQSAVVALGRLSGPYEDEDSDPLDVRIGRVLLTYAQKGKDQQARYFALMALAQAGGAQNRSALLSMLENGSKALIQPWAALSLGVLARDALDSGEAGSGREFVDTTVGERLQHWLGASKRPEMVGAVALALGLARYRPAAEPLRALLEEEAHSDELSGYLCLGLALLGDQEARVPIRRLLESSARRPLRLKHAAVALCKLGDRTGTSTLLEALTASGPNLFRLSAAASALGTTRDPRAVGPLIETMSDESLPDLARAFAAAALGGIARQEPMPWNSQMSTHMNYRAAVETWTNQISGVLDIL